jgi:DNA polymerase III sliding clamp (beta) subunit (PCNA family)
MPLERKKLIDYLSEVSPALAQEKMMPAYLHYWFTGKSLVAFSGHIAISMPYTSEFIGGIPQTILPLLQSSKAKEVELTPDSKKENLLIKAASSKFKLAMMPPTEFGFIMPKMKSDEPFPVDAAHFIKGIKDCLCSVGYETSHMEYGGITLIPDGKFLRLFATDRATFSTVRVPMTGEVDFERALLPAIFCKAMIKICDGAKALHMELSDDQVIVKNGNVTLFAPLKEVESPHEFIEIFKEHVPKEYKTNLAEAPTKLASVLERATIITESAVDKTDTQLTIKDGTIKFLSQSDRGEVDDTMTIGEDQPDIKVSIDPKRLLEGVNMCDTILFTRKAAILRRDNFFFMVTTNDTVR